MNFIKNLFVWWGRMSRNQYILSSVFLFIVWTLLLMWAILLWRENPFIINIVFLIRPILMYININLIVKRFHDLWETSSSFFLLLIPFYNIYIFFRLLFEKWIDNRESNTTNAKKKPKNIWKKILLGIGIFLGVFVCLWLLIGVSFNNSEAVQVTKKFIKNNQEIKNEYWNFELWRAQWSITETWLTGEAKLRMWIDGENKDGTVYVQAKKNKDIWKIEELIIKSEQGEEKVFLKKNNPIN